MRTKWLKQRRTVVVVSVLAGLILVLNSVHVNTYAILPGEAQPLAPMISISGVAVAPHPHATKSGFMMVDVSLQQMTALSHIIAEFRGANNMVELSALVPAGSTFDDFDRQSYLDMESSKDAAELNAFTALGWQIPTSAHGALVNDTTRAGPGGVVHESPMGRGGNLPAEGRKCIQLGGIFRTFHVQVTLSIKIIESAARWHEGREFDHIVRSAKLRNDVTQRRHLLQRDIDHHETRFGGVGMGGHGNTRNRDHGR